MAKCSNCTKLVSKRLPGLQCSKCSRWLHASCASISTDQLNTLVGTDSVDWKCRTCRGTTKAKRVSAILPDADGDEQSDEERLPIGQETIKKQDVLLEIRREIREIIRDELQRSLKFYSDQIDEFTIKISEYEDRVKSVSNQFYDLNNKYKNLSLRFEASEQKINTLEQHLLCNNIEICGIPKADNENLREVVSKIANKIQQKSADVVKIYRKESRAVPAQRRNQTTIVVSLREGMRDVWLDAAKSTQVSTLDLGMEGDSKIYIRESLTPATAFLLWKAKTELKEKNIVKFVWCKRGNILVRQGEKDKIHVIRSTKDIEKWVAETVK